MRYDAYEKKVKKVAAVLKVLVRHSVKIIIGLAVFTVLLSALLVAKGTVMSADCPAEIVYGDSVSCNANAFLSKVSFEFCSADGEWTKTAPTMPGEYKVRAVGKTTFGGTRYGEEMSLTIKSREITIDIASSSVIYGNVPALKADLAGGDQISCESFDFGEYLLDGGTGKISSTVVPVKEKLKITDKNGNDVTSAYDIKLEAKSIEVLPRALGVTVSDKSAEYNDMRLAYDGYEISDGALFGEDMLQAVFSDYIIDVGSTANTPELRVVDKNGKDITYCYDISTRSGELTVEPRPVIITTPTESFVYDGWDHNSYVVDISPETPLVLGHELYVTGSATANEVGTIDNTVNVKIVEMLSQEDKTSNYSIFVNVGALTVTPRPVTVYTESDTLVYDGDSHEYGVDSVTNLADGHYFEDGVMGFLSAGTYQIDVPVYIYDQNHKDVTKNYYIVYSYGTVVIDKRPVTVIPNGNTWTYDGYSHSETGYTLGAGSMDFAGTDMLVVTDSVSLVNAGSAKNQFLAYKIDNLTISADTDMIDNYDITFGEGGMLTVLPRPITVAPVYVEKIYDDTPIYATNIEIIGGSLVAAVNHYLFGTAEGERTIPGVTDSTVVSAEIKVPHASSPDKVLYDDISYNYDITYAKGQVVVLERPITVIPNDAEKVYDGTPLVATSAYVSGEPYDLVSGHVLAGASFDGWQTVVGVSDSTAYGAVIKNAKGEDITHYYDISYGVGKLTVTPRIIYIEPVYAEREYDGTALMATAWQYCSDTPYELVASHAITDIIYTGSITDVGEETSGIDVFSIVIMGGYLDVTPNYEIVARDGTLKVTQRAITVKLVNTTKVYDGLKTTQCALVAVSGSFADGQYGVVTVTTYSANVGTYIPTVSKESTVIYDENGQNVIDNYKVSYVSSSSYSYVTIEKRDIILKPVDERKVYDGTPLYPYRVEVSKSSPNKLVDGHFVSATFVGEQTEVGKSNSYLLDGSVFIYDSAVTDALIPLNGNYNITLETGTLTVLEKEPSGGGGGNDGGGSSGGGGSLDLSGNISGGSTGSDGAVHYRVKSEISGPVYIKLKSFGAYSGRSWSDATAYDKLIRSIYGADYLTASAFGVFAPSYRIEIESLTGQYALPYYLMMENDRVFEYDVQKSDVLYEGNADAIYSAYYSEFDWNADYSQSSAVIKKYESEYRSFVYGQYLDIDQETYDYMIAFAYNNNLIKETTKDTILAVAEYMRTHAATYNLEYDRSLDKEDNIAIAFLEIYKEGICQHYATSATLMYRALGIPARYTVGYVGDTVAGEWSEITSATAHAWVEVYLDGIGWVQVEVTGGGSLGGDGEEEEEKKIAIEPTYQYKKYDGDWLYPENELDGNMYFIELLEQGYTYDVEISGAQLQIGRSESVIESFVLYDPNGKDVTDEFEIKYYNGILEVIAAEITTVEVQLYELQQYYNGKPLEYMDGDYRILTKLDGVTVKLTLKIGLANVGKMSFSELNRNSSMYADFVVLNEAGQDISINYKLVFVPLGECDYPIRVDPREIEITTASAEKQYDGVPLTNGNYYITRGSLADGHTITLYTMGEITEVGSVDNMVDVIVISDANGRDVTKNYKITVVEGILTVLPEAE